MKRIALICLLCLMLAPGAQATLTSIGRGPNYDGQFWRWPYGAGYAWMSEVTDLCEGTTPFDSISLLESTGATYYTKIQAGNQSANLTLTLPTAYATSGYVLSSTDAGVLSWIANGSGTFAGGSVTGDIVMANGIYLQSSEVTAQASAIQVWDTTAAASYTNVLSWLNGAVPDIALGADTSTFALNSTTLDIAAGALTGVTGLAMTGNLTLDDSGDLKFGTGNDFVVDSDTASTLDITPAVTDESAIINFGADTTGVDLKGFAATTADYLLWDASDEALELVGSQVHLDDDSDLQFGTDKDFTVDSDTTKILDIVPAAASDDYAVNIGLDQSGVDVKMFGATTGEYALWDASEDTFGGNLGNVSWTTTDAEADQFKVDATGAIDGDAINFETTNGGIMLNADGAAYGDIELNAGDDALVTAVGDVTVSAANFYLGADDTDVPMVWYGETSGAEMTATGDGWTFDGVDVIFNEGDLLEFGDGGDVSLSSTSNVFTIGQIVSGTGEVAVGVNNKGLDVTFYAETDGDSLKWDQDGASNLGALIFEDSVLQFAGANSTYSYAISTDAMAVSATDHANSQVLLGTTGTNGLDLIWQTHTSGAELTFDAGADTVTADGVTFIFNEGDKLEFGDGGDLAFSSTTNLLTLSQIVSGTGSVAIGVEDKGIDVNFPSETVDDHMLWDQDGASNVGALTFRESVILFDQTNSDYTLKATGDALSLTATDAATSALTIGAGGGTHGVDVILQTHTAGAEATFDAGADTLTFDGVDIVMNDADTLSFGDSAAESTLQSDGSGTDWTLANGALTIGDGGTTNYASFAASTGALTFVGTARPTKGKYLPGQVFTAIAGTPVLTTEIGTNKGLGWAFDDTAEEGIVTSFTVPDDWAAGSDVTVNVYWCTSDASGVGVAAVWDVNSIPLASDEDFSGAAIIVDSVTDNLISGTAWDLNVSQAITIGASTEWAAGDLVSFMLFRDGDNAADDVTGDAVVLGVKISYTSDEP